MEQYLLLLLFPFLLSSQSRAQERMQWTVPFHFELGANWANDFQDDTLDTWSQGLGTAISLSAGIGMRYRQRFSASLNGGLLLDNYSYWITADSVNYLLTHWVWQARAHAHYLFPIKGQPDLYLHAGSDFGWTFYSPDRNFDIEPQYLIESESFGPSSFLVSPEAGVSKRFPFGEMSLCLFYAYHFRDAPSLRSRLYTEAGGDAYAEAKGDYGGFRMRFALDVELHKDPKEFIIEAPLETRVMELRKEKVVDRVTVNQQEHTLIVWDNSEIDGDTVSVMLDGVYVVHRLGLTKKKHRLRIATPPGEHRLVIMAHNEGRVPPNTASCKIRSGLFAKSMTISSSLNRNAVIELLVE